jgi:hypothetical protein
MKKFISFATLFLFSLFIYSQTTIYQSYFDSHLPTYIWHSAHSPYIIAEDITIHKPSNLIIEPGVKVIFVDFYRMDVKGALNAIGNEDDSITFTGKSWNGIRFDFSEDTNPDASKLHYCKISNSNKKGTNCSTPDPESSGGAIYVEQFSDLEILHCYIFENSVQSQGGAIGLYNNSSPIMEFNTIYSNYARKRGGGICMMDGCSPVISSNLIYKNHCELNGGGGIGVGNLGYNVACTPSITNNTFLSNTTNGNGGGVFVCNSTPYFEENTFSKNISYNDGGAVFFKMNSYSVFNGDIFNNNSATNRGGGILIQNCNYSYVIHINSCEFAGNSANDGGAVYTDDSQTIIINSIFDDNSASNKGGGVLLNNPYSTSVDLNKFINNEADSTSAIFCNRFNNSSIDVKIMNNLLVENFSNGKGSVCLINNNNNTIFNHNTISNNTSNAFFSGVCIDNNMNLPNQFKNNIIYDNGIDIVVIKPYYQLPSNYYTSLILENCIAVNPNFGANYHLSSSSNCIDAGDNSATLTVLDLDGNNRIINGTTDYGCYESNFPPPPIAKSLSIYGNVSNKPDINIYPNPTSDIININLDKCKFATVSIFDLSGRKVYSDLFNDISSNIIIPVNNFIHG